MKLNFYNAVMKHCNNGICFKIGAGLLVPLFLILAFGCKQSREVPFVKNSPIDMLPGLNSFGFIIQNTVELDKKDMLGLSQNIAGQFNIPASQKDLDAIIYPLKMARRMYFREDNQFIITVSMFEDSKTALSEFQNERTKLEESGGLLSKNVSMKVLPGKEIVVNATQGFRCAYNNILPQNTLTHTYILIWAKGPYVFKIESIARKFLSEEESLQIAGKIKY